MYQAGNQNLQDRIVRSLFGRRSGRNGKSHGETIEIAIVQGADYDGSRKAAQMDGLVFLVVCGLYVYLAKIAAQFVRRRSESIMAQYATVAVFVMIPTWDIIPGRLYHQHVCETQGGVQVYKTVEVDQAYFLPDRRLDEKRLLLERLDWQTTMDRTYSKIFHMTKHQSVLLDRKNREQLGTATDFWYYGGWLHTTIFIEAIADTCPQYPHHTVSSSLLRLAVHSKVDSLVGGKQRE